MEQEEDTDKGWHLNEGEEEDMILVAQHGIIGWGMGIYLLSLVGTTRQVR